ncbi:hypothetical protein GCM10009117_21060 [Gangjinia marincola]|uniref:50S ribosomal protein L27 n=1 Tax=Gangjinia marincola TaxID=578463 RepID=A0ABN1MIC4_9FLAO
MYTALKHAHSGWAYIVLIVLIIATANAFIGFVRKREYRPTDFRLGLFTLIATHIQFLIALVLWIISPLGLALWQNNSMKDLMGSSALRLYAVEHPITMIIVVALVTIGYSKHKKKLTSTPKLKTLTIFFSISLILMLSRIPWASWIG